MKAPRVFLSYSHDSPQHKAEVLSLARSLRADGCNVTIDQDELFPPTGWTLWMNEQIEQADFVLDEVAPTAAEQVEGETAQFSMQEL